MTATVQIVDKVGVGGTVLLDLNRHVGGILLGRGHNLAEVQDQQARGDTPFVWSPAPAEPGQLSMRQITVPLVLFAGTSDLVAGLIRSVRQATAGRFILKLQRHGSSTPVWLRCAGGSLQAEQPSMTGREDTTLAQTTLTAVTEPSAIGARVDVGPVTVTQDPASGTPFVLDINGVGGSELTPLVLRSADADVRGTLDRILVSVRRRGTPSALTGLWVQAETGTTTPGTAAPTVATFTGESGYSGGSGVRASYSAGASGPWALTVSFPALTGVEAPGTYRLLVRCSREGAAAGALFSLAGSAGPSRQAELLTAGGSDTRVVDLGLVQVPTAQPPFMSAPESPASAAAPSVTVSVYRAAAGGGAFVIDWVALVPADQECGALEVAQAAGSGVLAVDGYDQAPRLFTADPFTGSSPAAVGATGMSWIGRVPRLRPGANRLYVVAGLGLTTARSLAASLDLSASYWPRYGWIA